MNGRHAIFDDRRPRWWMADAACVAATDLDPAVFFPEKDLDANGGRSSVEMVAEAKAVCRGCSVRYECREYGMGEEYGIWGGTTPADRRRIRRDRRIAGQPSRAGRRKTVG